MTETRRDFLRLAAWGLLAAGAVGAGAAAVNLLRSTAPPERFLERWKGDVPVRDADGHLVLTSTKLTLPEVDSKAPLGGATGLIFLWRNDRGEVLPGIVVRDSGGQRRASSIRCTHLSCTVGWRDSDGKWACPCHHGVYSGVDGRVEAGPPPRPLQQFSLREDDQGLAVLELR